MSAGAVRQDGDGWIAGHDPRALAIGPPPMAALQQQLEAWLARVARSLNGADYPATEDSESAAP